MRIRSSLAALVLVAGGSLAAPPRLPGPAFPVFADAAAVDAHCRRGLAAAEAKVRQVERAAPRARWLAAYDDINALAEDAASAVYFVSNVHPDKAVREAAEACELRWQSFFNTLSQNERLYRAARRAQAADAIDREFLKQTLETFEDAGVGLPPAQRARAKAILDEVARLVQNFEKNIREDATRVAFDAAELQGVPERVWKDAKRDDQGRVLLGLDYPSVTPVLQNAASAAARERMWRAFNRQGGEANLALLAQIGQLRREYARLFGFASFSDFILRRRMAQSADTVRRFLDEVRGAVGEREKRELDELRDAKARELGLPPAEVKLERWDVGYYTERVKRERYSVDQDAFRPHFPPQQSLALVMRLAEKMLGVKYVRVGDVELWHPDAQAYAAIDLKTGRALATLYVDAYPREGKYNHAAVWPLRGSSTRLGRAPQAALVVNFDRQGLSLDELETLLHEFGHAVHNNLSRTRYSAQGGGAVHDFVEAPSQMLESWVYDPRVLAVMREVCPQCEPVPEERVAKARVAERYGKGVQYARQRLYASFDLAVYGADAPEPMALWRGLERETVLGHVDGSLFPAGFSHTANHYGSGYYGYLWSEVLAADLRTAFGSDKLDPKVGRRWRDTVLANGSQKPAQRLVREFLGRPSDVKAFFEDLQR